MVLGEAAGLLGVAAHQGHGLGLLGFREGGQNLLHRQAPQAHYRNADALVRGEGFRRRASLPFGGSIERRQREGWPLILLRGSLGQKLCPEAGRQDGSSRR